MPKDRTVADDTRFERALARGLRNQATPDGECPDAEIVAAFHERALTPEEHQVWEVHIAACARCQAQLAALVRTDDVPQLIQPARKNIGWLLDWRWLTSLATAAGVVLAIWAIDPGSVTDPPTSTVTDGAAVQPADEGRQQLPANRRTVDLLRAEEEAVAIVANRENETAEIEPPRQRAVLQERAADAPTELRARADDVVTLPRAEVTERRATSQSLTARRSTVSPVSALRFADADVIVSPDASVMWRFTTDDVERSTDGGSTWVVQFSADSALRAGSAPSANVCWLVGLDGTILRTVDRGVSWESIMAPGTTDLVGVHAVDAQSAQIQTADGRSFRTDDGGLSWTP